MKIRYISDIHLEFMKDIEVKNLIKKIPLGLLNEVCVLAGDIGHPYERNYDEFMKFINGNFKRTYVIAGNHEYYRNEKERNLVIPNRNVENTKVFMHSFFANYQNIRFLDNSSDTFENTLFLGTTLWSNIFNPEHEINDVHAIYGMDVKRYNQYHRESVDFLERELGKLQEDKKAVVITHHLPSKKLIDDMYLQPHYKPYNQWFYSDLDGLIQQHSAKIKYWIYGHTHRGKKSELYGVDFLCNPVGYKMENKNVKYNESVNL